MPEPYLTTAEVCRYLGGIHSRTLTRWRRERGFPAPTGVRVNLYSLAEINRWLEHQRKESQRKEAS